MKDFFASIAPHLKLAGAIFLALVVMIFTIQNVQAAPVRFFFWRLELSLSLLIFGTLAAGIVAGWLVTSWIYISRNRRQKLAGKGM
jgi:uncharacterized integral membrane protein